MIFKQKIQRQRRRGRSAGTDLSPRLAALVRESWWLLVVAVFAYLALILATYQRTDPGWSFSGTGAADSQQGRRRRRVACRSAAVPVRHLRLVVGVRRHRAGRDRLSASDALDRAADRHHPWLAVPGFALVLLSSSALEALRLYRLPASLPHAPGGALGEVIGSGVLARARIQRRHAAADRACLPSAGRCSPGCRGCA